MTKSIYRHYLLNLQRFLSEAQEDNAKPVRRIRRAPTESLGAAAPHHA